VLDPCPLCGSTEFMRRNQFRKGQWICENPPCIYRRTQAKSGLLPPPEKVLCSSCGSEELAKIKGCIRCLKCGFKEDCNGW